MTLVSIITVSYNTDKFIEDNILSVENQDYPSIEHLIIDGGSTDNTIDILKKHSLVKWISEPDNGITDAFNKGIKMAKGKILAFLNADDMFYTTEAISKAVKAMEDNPEAGVIFGDCAFIDTSGNIIGYFKGQGKQYSFERLFCSEYTIPLASTFIRKSATEAMNGELDAEHDLAADWEMWIRIGLKLPIMYVEEMFGAVREGNDASQSTYHCARANPAKRRLVLDSISRKPVTYTDIQPLIKRAYAGTYVTEAILLLNIGCRKEAIKCIMTAIKLYPLCLLVYLHYIFNHRFYQILFRMIRSKV